MKPAPFAIAALFLSVGLGAEAAQRIPLSAAMAQCKGLNGVTEIAKQQYRACVVAKSGKAPPAEKPKSGISVSGSARIGIVVSN